MAGVVGIPLFGKHDTSQELNAGTIRADPQADVEIVGNGRPPESVSVMNVAAVLGLDLDGLGALAAMNRFIGKLVECLFIGGIVQSRHPNRIASLEAILNHLLTSGGAGESQRQCDRRDPSASFHDSPLLAYLAQSPIEPTGRNS